VRCSLIVGNGSAGGATIDEPLHVGRRVGVEVGYGEDATDVIDSCTAVAGGASR